MTPDTFPSLFWSYTAVWVVLVVYVATLGIRLARIERTISGREEARDGSGKTTA